MYESTTSNEKITLRRRIIFNVNGTTFETWSDTVGRFPTTLLGNPNKLWQYFSFETERYNFNRDKFAFEAILYFFQSSGKLIRPSELSIDEFEQECVFYQIPKRYINTMKENEGFFIEKLEDEPFLQPVNMREKLWLILDYPATSKLSFCYGIVSISVLISWCAFCCAQTMRRQELAKNEWFLADVTFAIFFATEYLLRLITAPNLIKFLKMPLSVFDFISTLPYLVVLFFQDQKNLFALRLMRQLRLFRLLRLLKMFSSSERIKLLQGIIASSLHDFGLLLLCLLIVIVVGGSLLYFAEIGTKETQFTSVPESMWWAIQTVVVLGYGDIVPKSNTGKIIASFFMIFGAITISLPVLSVVTKLVDVYGRNCRSPQI